MDNSVGFFFFVGKIVHNVLEKDEILRSFKDFFLRGILMIIFQSKVYYSGLGWANLLFSKCCMFCRFYL